MSGEATEAAARLRRMFAQLALAAAALTFVVIVASAILRQTQVGLSCADWPACYGQVDASAADTPPSTGVRLVRIAHRIAATGVLALIVGMLLVAWTQEPAWKRQGTLALAALVIAAALAVLGVATPGARLPAVTLGNLLGGYLLLAVLTATATATTRTDVAPAPWHAPNAPLRWIALAVLALAFAQASLGALIGAQYALTACPTLGKCPGFAFDEFVMTDALDPFRPLSIAAGRVIPPPSAAGVYVMHRALGIVVAVITLVLAYRWREVDRRRARMLAAFAVAVPLLGVAAIAAVPSLPLTILHNAAAALLVAGLAAAVARPFRGS